MGYNRLIYFSTYNGEVPNVDMSLSNIAVSQSDYVNNSQALTYIQNFLNTIKNMASRQRQNQQRYIKKYFEDNGIKISDYGTGDKFDYIKFIKDLNLTRTSMSEFSNILNTFEKRISDVNRVLNAQKGKNYEYTFINQEGKKETLTGTISRKNADKLYKQHKFQQYQAMVNQAVKEYNTGREEKFKIRITDTINAQLLSQIQKIMSQIPQNTAIIEIIKQFIISGSANTAQLQGAIITTIIASLKENNFDIDKTIQQLAKEDENTKIFWKNNLQKGLTISYENILKDSEKTKTLEDFFEKIINSDSGEGIADDFIKQVKDGQINRLANNPIGQQLAKEMETVLDIAGKSAAEIKKAKQNFSKTIFKLISEEKEKITGKKKNQKLGEQEAAEVMSFIEQNFIDNTKQAAASININAILNNILTIGPIKGCDMGEIVAAVQAYLAAQTGDISSIFIPGTIIKLKNDVSFTYHINNISEIKFPKNSKIDISRLNTLLEQQGKNFLQRYNDDTSDEKTKGATNIKSAYKHYLNLLKEINEERKKQLSNTRSKRYREKINKLLQTFLTSVSVKEYKFYNNDIGYSAGSMGGGGRVVDAVPQLLEMIRLGGISPPDADAVIFALLNSFSGSYIGTGYVEDLQNFLLLGAAMMLFDDGFTSGIQFLKDVENVFNGEVAAPMGLHLMSLDGIYIPQSYILQNIYENLSQVYGQILQRFDAFAHGNATGGAKASVVLNNNINRASLRNAYYQARKNNSDPWEQMSNYAQNTVTISYFFMAGMLDIVSNLKNIIK